MKRMIDANALSIVKFTALINEYAKGWNDAVDAIMENAPTEKPEPQWIPCSERLPEENGVYLVYAPEYRGGSSRGKEWHDGIMFATFKAGKWSIEHGYYSRPNCVIAWMPLPEPYEVEE